MCMYVRMDYPCMYLCIYFYNILHTVCDVQVSGEKNYGCHWNFYFSLSLRQYYLFFCCFKDVSISQGVICKLSFLSLLQYVLLRKYRKYTVLLSHFENTVIN